MSTKPGAGHSVIHARLFNAPLGVGIRVDKRASFYEVLMTEKAILCLDEHLAALAGELAEFNNLLALLSHRAKLKEGSRSRERFEQLILTHYAPLDDQAKRREALPPLPEFPDEQELIEARSSFYKARIAELLARAEPIPN